MTQVAAVSADIVLHNAFVVTMDGALTVLRDGAIAVVGDRIAAVGPSADVLGAFPGAAQTLNLGGRILLPGFVNTHVHTSQQLARGIADDVDLMTWLHGRIWPYESHMTEDDSYASTLLCGIELIRSGQVTCFAEAGGQYVSEMARAVELLGLRACLTKSTMDCGDGLPPNWSSCSTDDCIQSQKDLYEKHHNTADGRIRIWFGLRQIMNATDRLLLETRDAAQELNTGIHMHIAEIPYENQLVMRMKKIDHGTVTYLEKIDFLRSNLLAAHSVWLNESEISHFSNAGVKVSHCPASAMRMLGFAPIREMLDSGVCVSLGTDGAPSNNRMSIVDEMYLASLINKGREAYISGTTNPTVFPSETLLTMATINGAKAVLWDNEIGSLEVGKKADLIVVNPFKWSMLPLHDSIANIVYCMRSENIESVMCNGQWIMKDQKIMNVNEEEVISSAVKRATALLARAGINLPERMNYL
ncbi:5-methylthioadenosine/S-adenosylhomocysteine deaminase-like isoform X1 [Triticum dicoccoides]|uniref:5-methylthioadenosine/S-adenosylhomocysteine deaminase-like isoform X1 n=1 Tax=Triticum dicoccoides TaxID=85692 RepID=UPI0018908C01|nr:5-methylthioadenosine/S-adenosylhomocysteine deaminase-like isoform X1 [Triticum dicoccoides]